MEIPLRERRLFTACVRELGERQRAQAELERPGYGLEVLGTARPDNQCRHVGMREHPRERQGEDDPTQRNVAKCTNCR